MNSDGLSLKKNIWYNSIGSFFYLGCQWIITVLVVRLSSYDMAGMLSLAISITNVFYTVSVFGMRAFQVSDYENQYSHAVYVYSRIVTGGISLILCLIFLLCNRQYSAMQFLIILFYMVFKVIEAMVDVMQGIQQKADRMDYIAVSCFARGVLSLGSFVVVMILTKNLLFAILAMIVLTALVLIFYDFRICGRLYQLREHFQAKKIYAVIRECFPLMLSTLFITSLVSIPRYFLELEYGSEALGKYASVATPTVIVQVACGLIYNPLISRLTESYVECRKKEYIGLIMRSLLAILIFFVFLTIGAALLGEWGMVLLFGEEIRNYVYLLIPVLFTTLLIALIYFEGILLTVMRRLKTQVVVNGAAAVCVMAISLWLVKTFGMQGVNITLYIGAGLSVLLSAICIVSGASRHFREK